MLIDWGFGGGLGVDSKLFFVLIFGVFFQGLLAV